MDNKKIFADRLVELRESRGISQQVLADDLEITRQSLSLYETAKRTINIDLLVKIAKYFNVSTDYLLGLNDNATTDIELKAVCDYTGLSEEASHLLNLLNQVKQLDIIDFQPPIIDIINSFFKEIDENYYCLFTLRKAININIKDDDEKLIIETIKSISTSNINSQLLSGRDYRDFLMQKCNEQFKKLVYNVMDSMSGDFSKADYVVKEVIHQLQTETFTQICENIIASNKAIEEVFYNGNNNKKDE